MVPELGAGKVPEGCAPARYLATGDIVEGSVGPLSCMFTVTAG